MDLSEIHDVNPLLICRAIASMLDASAARAKLTRLADQLTAALEEADCHFVAKLESLSGIGRLIPEVFAEHAIAVVDFVTKVGFLATRMHHCTGVQCSPICRHYVCGTAGGVSCIVHAHLM